jgi:hypothetical protein
LSSRMTVKESFHNQWSIKLTRNNTNSQWDEKNSEAKDLLYTEFSGEIFSILGNGGLRSSCFKLFYHMIGLNTLDSSGDHRHPCCTTKWIQDRFISSSIKPKHGDQLFAYLRFLNVANLKLFCFDLLVKTILRFKTRKYINQQTIDCHTLAL